MYCTTHTGYESDEEEENGDAQEEEGNREVAQKAAGVGATGEKRKRKKKKKGQEWDKASNKWVYITGLPHDVTNEEVSLSLGAE